MIDILVVVHDDSAIKDYDGHMSGVHYTPRGECLDAGGTPGRFYYSKTVDGVRTHQVHVCRVGYFQIAELLLFPRYLREHGDVSDAYARLKLAAIAEGDVDTPGYMARKHDWIRSTVREAPCSPRSLQSPSSLSLITSRPSRARPSLVDNEALPLLLPGR